jgi:hypothetical protein
MQMISSEQSPDNGQRDNCLNMLVKCIGENSVRVHPGAEIANELPHPFLHQNRGEKYPRKCWPVVYFMGLKYLMDRSFPNLYPRDEEEHGHDQRRHVLHPALAKWCLCGGRLGGNPKAYYQDNGVCEMGEKMKGVGHY